MGLELCRRILGCGLPSAISAFEIASVSSAASYMFNVEGVTKALHWELRPAPAGARSPRLNLLSVMAEGTGVARFAEWSLPRESDVSFKPERERFAAFAHAVRRREAGLLINTLADGRVTTALLRLSTLAAQAGRPLRFDPLKERFIGERPALQEKLC